MPKLPVVTLPRSIRHAVWLRRVLLIGGVFVIALMLYISTAAPTITTRHGGADGGELAAAALSGGVAHPPGYPTYLLLARAALRAFDGEPAARLALLSAICSAGAAACTASLVAQHRSTAARGEWTGAVAGAYAGLVLASGARVWSQAVIVEVYALHLLFLSLTALLVCGWLRTARTAWFVLAALVLGVGMGNHPTLLVVLPAALVAWWAAPQRPRLSRRAASAALLALVLGVSVYGLLPWWGARGALPSWGDQRTWAGWWAHVSSADYRYLVGRVPVAQQLVRVGYSARDLVAQPGPVALGLALWAWPALWYRYRSLFAFTATVAVGSVVFALGYGGADGTVYLLPWTWAWCVWAGVGAAAALHTLGARRGGRAIGAGILAGSVLLAIILTYPRVDLHADTRERERVVEQIHALPPNALLITHTDADTFGTWYVQRALGVRPDLVVIDTRLAQHPWYQAQVMRQMYTDGPFCTALGQTPRPAFAWNAAGVAVLPDVRAALPPCSGR